MPVAQKKRTKDINLKEVEYEVFMQDIREELKNINTEVKDINTLVQHLYVSVLGVPDSDDKGLYGKVCNHEKRLSTLERMLYPLIVLVTLATGGNVATSLMGLLGG